MFCLFPTIRFSFFSVWSIIGLAGFHTYLTSTNLTTNEDIKGSYSSKRSHDNFNPFSRGNVFANCFNVLCDPMNPSLIDARGFVTEQYLVSNNLSDVGVNQGYGAVGQQHLQNGVGTPPQVIHFDYLNSKYSANGVI